MAHGQDARPIESEDGSKVSVGPDESGHSALSTNDRTATAVLEDILVEQRKIRRALEILIDEELTDED